MRDVTDAHFLHQRTGLEPVVRPPVDDPIAIVWIPRREELLVASKDGRLQTVDPLLGTRTIAEDVGECAALAVHADRNTYALVTRDGKWSIGQIKGEVLHSGSHGYLAGMDAFFVGDNLVTVGDGPRGRRMSVIVDGTVRGRVKLPPRVAPYERNGRLYLARSTPAGLQRVPFGRTVKFPSSDPTQHRLKGRNGFVVGTTPSGVCLWDQDSHGSRSMRLPDLTAADVTGDGQYLGLGTRGGAVVLAHIHSLDRRVRPNLVKAFESAVTCVAFSTRGRWLASGADGLQLWTWEEP